MFKLWVKEIKDNHLLRDVTIEDKTDDTRTHKIMHSLEKMIVFYFFNPEFKHSFP